MPVFNYDPEVPVWYVPVQALSFPAQGGGSILITGDLLLAGWSLYETTGAAVATVDLYDGGDATGQFIARVNLNPGQCVQEALPVPGVYLTRGLFVNVIAGSVAGAVWVRDV